MDHEDLEKSQPFYLNGGKTGVLLLHGFTSTPYVLRGLGELLHQHGYTVSAPLIAGHGTTPEDLETKTGEDWYNSVENAYVELREKCDKIFVIGVSFGGNLGCCLVAKYPEIKGLVMIGSPRWTRLHYFVRYIAPIAVFFGYRFYRKPRKYFSKDGPILDGPACAYQAYPVRSLIQLYYLMEEVSTDALERIHVPTLIIQSNRDGLVQPKSGKFFFDHIPAENKQLLWISEPHHTLHTGPSKDQIYSYISEFLTRWE